MSGEVWQILRASVRGATHRRAGLPNQDAVRIARGPDPSGPGWILALADGHGSARSFRSQQGARMAVATGLALGARLLTLETPLRIKRWAEEQAPSHLVRHWRARVARAVARHPFTELELAPLAAGARRQVTDHPPLAYGTTLLLVAVSPVCILYLQLGDGDLLTVAPDGAVERPFARDPRLIANETLSLCSERAGDEVRVYVQTLAAAPPALILAATDGYANAFRDDAGFRQVASDLWSLLRAGGAGVVRSELRGWLDDSSSQGSGDDISVGLIWRMESDGALQESEPR